MASEKRVRVKIGDVFAISLNQNRYCYGQVVSEGRKESDVSKRI